MWTHSVSDLSQARAGARRDAAGAPRSLYVSERGAFGARVDGRKNPFKVEIAIPCSKNILAKNDVRIQLGYYVAAEQVPERRVAQYCERVERRSEKRITNAGRGRARRRRRRARRDYGQAVGQQRT